MSANSEILEKCLAMDIKLTSMLEAALQENLAELMGSTWASENRNEIAAYNEFVEDSGCFGDEFREF